jgi:hypothetical protein
MDAFCGCVETASSVEPSKFSDTFNMQCAYDVTLRRVRELLLLWKSDKYYLYLCVGVHARTLVDECTGVGVCVAGV